MSKEEIIENLANGIKVLGTNPDISTEEIIELFGKKKVSEEFIKKFSNQYISKDKIRKQIRQLEALDKQYYKKVIVILEKMLGE